VKWERFAAKSALYRTGVLEQIPHLQARSFGQAPTLWLPRLPDEVAFRSGDRIFHLHQYFFRNLGTNSSSLNPYD
jgi:hypothetical protein